jgi:CheY-like chemotaxis protein
MCGAEATRILRETEAVKGRRRLPVIGISASSDNEEACIAAGVDAW